MNLKECNGLDDFLERIRGLVKDSKRSSDQAYALALTIAQTVSEAQGRGFLDALTDAIGLWNTSEVFILEKRLDECEIVQAGMLPEGALISFKNEYN